MEQKMNIPFSPPDISQEEINEVAEALRSGWITTGPRTKELERLVAAYVGTNKACCLNSQTACAELALRVLGIGPGDEVIVPAYTYTASASVVCHVGATLRLIDCQENSLEMDYDALEKAITDKTKAIIAVDLAGIPCDYDRIFAIAEAKKGLFKPASQLVPFSGGPYYAVQGHLNHDGAFGGVLVNPYCQAYAKDGGLVSNLFVPGDFASGRFTNHGDVKEQVINDLGWAISSGWTAGKAAAEYVDTL